MGFAFAPAIDIAKIENIMPPTRVNSNDTAEIIRAIGDVNTTVATRFGEVTSSIARMEAKQDSFQREIGSIVDSVRDVRSELASLRAEKAPRRELETMAANIEKEIASKASTQELEAHGQMLENLSQQIAEVSDKIDSIGKIEDAVQRNQVRLDQVEIDLKPLTVDGNKAQGRRDVMKIVWGMIVLLIGWAIAITAILVNMSHKI